MIVKWKILPMSAGLRSVSSGQFIGLPPSSILKVKREGVGVDRIDIVDPWTTRDFMFVPGHGLIIFNASEPAGPAGEKVYVLYKK